MFALGPTSLHFPQACILGTWSATSPVWRRYVKVILDSQTRRLRRVATGSEPQACAVVPENHNEKRQCKGCDCTHLLLPGTAHSLREVPLLQTGRSSDSN